VSTSGQAVTFDNWFSMGYGNNVIVIYKGDGEPVRSLSLDDLLPKEYIKALPRTVSSMWWGSHHRISADDKQLFLRVVVPSVEAPGGSGDSESRHIELALDMATGVPIPPSGEDWDSALESARQLNAAAHLWEEQNKARFIAPLRGPESDSEPEWHGYLREAFFRIDADWKNGYPATKVLRRPESATYEASVGFVRDALNDKTAARIGGAIMIASPSQDNLIRVLSDLAPKVQRGSLKNVRLYVAVDDAHSPAVAKLLASTGATYIQLDPTKPIAQRKARLDSYRDSDGQKLAVPSK
jgi:hypothetical protein